MSLTSLISASESISESPDDNVFNILDINKYLTKEIKNKYPKTRTLNVSYQFNSGSDYKTKLYNEPYQDGTRSVYENLDVALNLPFYNVGRQFILAGIGRYNYDWIKLKNITPQGDYPSSGDLNNHTNKYQYFNFGLNATYLTNINQKLLIFNALVLVEGGQTGVEGVKAYLYASYALKQSKDFNMTIGLIGIINNKTSIPVVPSFSIYYKLQDGWELDAFLPKSIFVRKELFKNSRLSLGCDLSGRSYFMKSTITGPKKTYFYKSTQIKSGALFEHQISESFLVSVAAGIQTTFGGRLIPSNKSHKHDIMKIKQNPNFYFETSISFNLPRKR